MIFAEFDISSIPVGFDNWLMNTVCFVTLAALFIGIYKMTRPNPSLEKQINKLRAEFFTALNEQGKRFSDTFATRTEMVEKIDHREETAIEFRNEVRLDIKELDKKLSDRSGDIFDAIRSLGREVSNIDGRLSRSGRLMTGEGK